ncbi:MAG: hypothetical protein AAGA92_00675 [Planctomycetota bacterium]
MSHYSHHQARQQRRRRKDTAWVFALVRTAVSMTLLAAAAIWLDVPEKLREKTAAWRGETAPRAEEARTPVQSVLPQASAASAPAGSEQPSRAPSVPERPVARPAPAVGTRSDAPGGIEPSNRSTEVAPGRVTRGNGSWLVPLSRDTTQREAEERQDPERYQQTVVLDLSKKSTLITDDEIKAINAASPGPTVLRFSGASVPHVIEPAGGQVVAEKPVDVLLPDHPNVRIRVELENVGGRLRVRVSPQMTFSKGSVLPFMKSRVKALSYKTRKNAAGVVDRAVAARDELERIKAWLATPGVKVLQTRIEARTRAGVLERQLPELEAAAKNAQGDVALLESLESLADSLDQSGKLVLAWELAQ